MIAQTYTVYFESRIYQGNQSVYRNNVDFYIQRTDAKYKNVQPKTAQIY